MPTTSSRKSDAAALPSIGGKLRAQTDWVVVLIPAALTVFNLSSKASVLAIFLLGVAAFVRRTPLKQSVQAGPLLVLAASAGIVLIRPADVAYLGLLLVLTVLVFRLVKTVDARVIIGSLIDGVGIYMVVNVLGYVAGLKSPGAGDRIGALESGGVVRTIFPFSGSLEVAPTIASLYIGAAVFLISEPGWARRSFRLACLIASLVIVSLAGARTGLFTAIVVPILVICLPFATRWIGQTATLLSSVSALFLPSLISSVQTFAIPILSYIAPNRGTRDSDIISVSSRDLIWRRSINYWIDYVNGMHDRLLGFGQDGQFRSGASLTYADALATTVRHPERASMHNSFLQQLFDGGLAGWFLLTLGILWASVRLARRRPDWGARGVAAIVAIVALLVNAMTQVSISPGFAAMGFWLLVVFVGVACQSPSHDDMSKEAHQGD